MPVYKITRPAGSERQHCHGIELKNEGDCFYIDDHKVAASFNRWGWRSEEVEAAPEGVNFYPCLKTPSLRVIMDDQTIHVLTKPGGKWLITRPPLLALGPMRYGVDVTKPFEVTDYDLAEKFKKDGFIVEAIAKKVAPKTEPEVIVIPEPVGDPAPEGGDVPPKPKGRVSRTIDQITRG